jgi:hypothetical protein
MYFGLCENKKIIEKEKKRRKILKQFKTDKKVYLFEKLFERIIKRAAENFA